MIQIHIIQHCTQGPSRHLESPGLHRHDGLNSRNSMQELQRVFRVPRNEGTDYRGQLSPNGPKEMPKTTKGQVRRRLCRGRHRVDDWAGKPKSERRGQAENLYNNRAPVVQPVSRTEPEKNNTACSGEHGDERENVLATACATSHQDCAAQDCSLTPRALLTARPETVRARTSDPQCPGPTSPFMRTTIDHLHIRAK